MICGCGRGAGYHFPKGKTLVYVVYEQVGNLDEDGKRILSEPMALLEVRLKVWDNYGDTRRITISAHPPFGRSDIHSGRDLGQVVVKVDDKGIHEIVKGTKMPTEIRYFIPTFPSNPKKGLKWIENIKVLYKKQPHEIKITREHKGVKNIDGKKCSFIEGRGSRKLHEEREDPANRLYAVMDFDFNYSENNCIDFNKGYLLETVIERKRLRQIKEKSSADYFINQTDMAINKVVLERIE